MGCVFQVLSKNWPDCPYKIILNTETKTYSYNGFDIACPCVARQIEDIKGYSWSDRVKDTLKLINTKYTLFLLEDFYIENKIDNLKVEDLLNRLDKIKKFGALYLMDVSANYPNYYDKDLNLYKIHKYVNFKANATAAIWNTSFLQSVLKRGESPWDLEQRN